jgi:hypothetical protein
VVVLWVIVPCSLVVGNVSFGGHAASIFRVEVRDPDDGDVTLVCNHQTAQHNPENHDIYFSAMKNSNHVTGIYPFTLHKHHEDSQI